MRYLIVHYSGMPSAEDAIARLCNSAYQVSAHYLIDENGTVTRMVPENMSAWHAGAAFWRGVRDINSASVGIELANPGHEHGYHPFPPVQMDAFVALASDIMARHGIPPAGVLGHSDVAPGRKIDPGELFDWAGLAKLDIGLWLNENMKDIVDTKDLVASMRQLSHIGYAVPLSPELGADILNPATGLHDVIAAFQRRYRQKQVDGILDDDTAWRIATVTKIVAAS